MWRVLTGRNAGIALLILLGLAAGPCCFPDRFSWSSRLLALEFLQAAGTVGPAETSSLNSDPGSPSEGLPAPIAVKKTPHELATQILHLALQQSVWGPPAWCRVRQKMHAYDHQITSFGSFVRAGKGSGKLKLQLQFPAAEHVNVLTQISDGQRLQTIETLAGARKRTIVDLVEVRSRLIINDQTISDPVISMYLAIGGQAESLRKLCQQYEWHAVGEGEYDGAQVWLLSGRLAQTPVQSRAFAETDKRLLNENWSGLLPTSVEVAIGKGSQGMLLPYWLYQVQHFRNDDDPSPSNLGTGLQLVTEWFEPRSITQPIGPDMFEASTTNDLWYEETEDYLPPPLAVADRRFFEGNTDLLPQNR